MSSKPEGWLFTGPSVVELRDRLNAAFEAGPNPRFFVRKEPKVRGQPQPKVTLHVLPEEDAEVTTQDGGINDSHGCPGAPGCPPK